MQDDENLSIESNPSANQRLKAADSLQSKGSIYLIMGFVLVPIVFLVRSMLHSSLHIWLFVSGAIISMGCVASGAFMIAEGGRIRRNTIRGWVQPKFLSERGAEVTISIPGLKTQLILSLAGSAILFMLSLSGMWIFMESWNQARRLSQRIETVAITTMMLMGIYLGGDIFLRAITGLRQLKSVGGRHVVINEIGLKVFSWLVSGNSRIARKTFPAIYLEIPWEKIISFEVLSLKRSNTRSENPWYLIRVSDQSEAFYIERQFFFGKEKKFLELLSKHLLVQISIQDDLRG